MCKYCKGTGLFYSDRAMGIEVKRCPVCQKQDDSFAEFQKRLRAVERRLEEKGA